MRNPSVLYAALQGVGLLILVGPNPDADWRVASDEPGELSEQDNTPPTIGDQPF